MLPRFLPNQATTLRAAWTSTAASSSRGALRPARAYASAAGPIESGAGGLDNGEQVIYDKLRARFQGKQLQVQDVSGELAMASATKLTPSGGCGSFYAILISSPAFKGLSTVKQHKLVNECLKEDIKGIHGLQVSTHPL